MTHADIDRLEQLLSDLPALRGHEGEERRLSELIRLAHIGLDAESRPTPPTYFGLPVTYREGNPDPGPF